jgi:cyanophycinase-like exopeptidase
VQINQEHFERRNRLGRQMEWIAREAAWLSAVGNLDDIFPTHILS